jgi:hypothetical protein
MLPDRLPKRWPPLLARNCQRPGKGAQPVWTRQRTLLHGEAIATAIDTELPQDLNDNALRVPARRATDALIAKPLVPPVPAPNKRLQESASGFADSSNEGFPPDSEGGVGVRASQKRGRGQKLFWEKFRKLQGPQSRVPRQG